MYVVLLRFTENKSAAAAHLAGHQGWVARGLEDGVFLLVGTIQPGLGGAVFAYGTSLADLEERVAADPFVLQGVVDAEIIEITPGTADDRLDFLVA